MDQLLDRQVVMGSNVLEQAVEQTNFERVVIGNGDVVLSASSRGQLDMRSGLPPCFVAEAPQRTDQISATTIAGYLHAASTSSRT